MIGDNKEKELTVIREKLKELLVSNLAFLDELDPKDIKNDAPLFGEGLGLDSLDAVEIVVLLQRHFSVEIKDMTEGREAFASIDALANYVYDSRAKKNE